MNPTTLPDRYPTRLIRGEPTPRRRVDPVVWGDRPGPLGPDDIATFDRDGYVSFPALVDAGDVDALLTEARRLAADPGLAGDERVVREPDSDEVRSIFEVHRLSDVFAEVIARDDVAGIARQILDSEVCVHQSRVNLKPGFTGAEFDWHSDFETWHAEDGLPAMRTVSVSLALTPNYSSNGALMIIPGSHRTFIPCIGATPDDHFRSSLRRQEIGVPAREVITELAGSSGIDVLTGDAGSAVVFDCNCLHGSNSNITPFPRSNLFVVFNSVDNAPVAPFAGTEPRPEFIAARPPVVV